jgi:hypothetical protein
MSIQPAPPHPSSGGDDTTLMILKQGGGSYLATSSSAFSEIDEAMSAGCVRTSTVAWRLIS